MAASPATRKANSPSRLGLTLQGYDQIVALNQACINTVLQNHYSNHPELCKIEVLSGAENNAAIRGTIQAPEIELIDLASGGDQAFYCLTFEEGSKFTYFKPKPADPNAKPIKRGPDDPPSSAVVWEKVTVHLEEWKLAFYVSFGRKRMAREDLSPELKKKIDLPGNYSVEQLLVIFGTADLLTFDWSRSKTPGLGDDLGNRTMITLLISNWITPIKDSKGSHNVLGYAVTVPKEDISPVLTQAPSFPPTAVELQVINDRHGGDASKASPSNGYNAFIFTEMTGVDGPTRMPAKDLEWSGDIFYESLGGTLGVSRRIFWDEFIQRKLQSVNMAIVKLMNNVAQQLCPQDLLTDGIRQAALEDPGRQDLFYISDSDNLNGGAFSGADGLGDYYEWKGNKTTTAQIDPGIGLAYQDYKYVTTTTVSHKVYPTVGTGTITLHIFIEHSSTLTLGLSGRFGQQGTFVVTTKAKVDETTSVTFDAVDGQGGIGIKLDSTGNAPDVDIQTNGVDGPMAVILRLVPGASQMFGTQHSLEEKMDFIRKMIGMGLADAATPAHDVAEALSNQNRFVLPGAGSFTMKSPIFNNSGDLLIGLTWLDK